MSYCKQPPAPTRCISIMKKGMAVSNLLRPLDACGMVKNCMAETPALIRCAQYGDKPYGCKQAPAHIRCVQLITNRMAEVNKQPPAPTQVVH